jgi:acyl-CoA synthetase (AMP-forming)/AMP-acid ligase II
VPRLPTRLRHGIATVRTLAEAGIIAPIRPDRLIRVAGILKRMGATPASGYAVAATRYPDAPAISDERGRLSFQEVHARTNALAHALADDGLKPGDRIAIMCRNHRWFIDTFIATAKLGADVQLINTSFSGPQVAGVVAQEQPDAIVFDDEFAPLMEQAGVERLKRYVAWTEPDAPLPDVHGRVEDLITGGDPTDPPVPPRIGRIIILTSGTTGAPKGAARSHPRSLSIAASLLDRIPLRAREPTLIAAPLFHSWGLGNMSLGISLSSTLVLRRRFDPLETVQTLAQERCTAFIAVPVMLQRILELPPETTSAHDLSRLRVVSLSGSALAPALAAAWMDRFGETIYNLYGSTEVAWATIATPEDLRAAPGTAGKPPRGTLVRLFDDNDRPVAQGNTGRIFVGNELAMEGYTGGTSKQSIGGMLSSGDVGHFDSNGRLFVDGRDDDMIVSGGENVFPAEVEDLLCGHPAIREAAVLGVPDERFGQRLRAYVVRFEGAELEADEVRAYVKENLAPYKAPRDVEFVDELPRTATGKVLKRALPTG